MITDKKFRPEDDGIYQEERQKFQESEKNKKAEGMSEEEFVTKQDEKNEG